MVIVLIEPFPIYMGFSDVQGHSNVKLMAVKIKGVFISQLKPFPVYMGFSDVHVSDVKLKEVRLKLVLNLFPYI